MRRILAALVLPIRSRDVPQLVFLGAPHPEG
jgi:hypothetical protein